MRGKARQYKDAQARCGRLRSSYFSFSVAVAMMCWAGTTLQTANAQSGGNYLIKKGVVASGGHSNIVGGNYRLSATVGQHDAAELSGGNYALSGGFWSPHLESPPIDPAVDPSGINKCRFVSFSVPSDSSTTAIRVKLMSLHHVVPPYPGGVSVPFTSFEGQVRWVGPPAHYVESSSNPTPFYAASLQCTPHYQDWSTVGLLHLTGSAIVPSSVYEVVNVGSSCMGIEAGCTAVSSPLTVNTTRWGDVETPFNPPSTTTQPDLGDVAALVNKFKSAPGAPIKPRVLLAGDDAIGNISPLTLSLDLGFGHIAACVDAFKGKPYPHTIQVCP